MLKRISENIYYQAITSLKVGKVIAYPTEALYGLGCDLFNEAACNSLLQLKQRDVDKGLMLFVAAWQHIKPFVKAVSPQRFKIILESWPGPYTWIFRRVSVISDWISGAYNTVAVRMTHHPVARQFCKQHGKPIVSTSANLSGQQPAKIGEEVCAQFWDAINYIVPGSLVELTQPTEIRDAETHKFIRFGGNLQC